MLDAALMELEAEQDGEGEGSGHLANAELQRDRTRRLVGSNPTTVMRIRSAVDRGVVVESVAYHALREVLLDPTRTVFDVVGPFGPRRELIRAVYLEAMHQLWSTPRARDGAVLTCTREETWNLLTDGAKPPSTLNLNPKVEQ